MVTRDRGRDRGRTPPTRGRERERERPAARPAPRERERERPAPRERESAKPALRKSASSRPKFDYHRRDYEETKRRLESSGRNFDAPIMEQFDMLVLQDGDNYVRILPQTWEPPPKNFAYPVKMHRFIGSDGSNYLCRRMLNEPCAICEEEAYAKKKGLDEEAKDLRAKDMHIAWTLNREGKNPDKPMAWIMSYTQESTISSQTQDSRSKELIEIEDPDVGYDLRVNKTGKGLNTRYQFVIDRNPSPMHDDPEIQDEIWQFIQDNPIPDILKFYDNAYLESILSGIVDSNTEEEEPEVRGRAAPARGRSRPEPEPEDDEDDGDDTEEPPFDEDPPPEDDDEPEETLPARSRRPVPDRRAGRR